MNAIAGLVAAGALRAHLPLSKTVLGETECTTGKVVLVVEETAKA
jgi:hypothetical protein